MRVSDLKVGVLARVIAMGTGNKAYRQRLLAMGLIPGTAFKVLRIAPFGDPIEIEVRGFALSLRKTEANILQIDLCHPDVERSEDEGSRA